MKVIKCARCNSSEIDEIVRGHKVAFKCYHCNRIYNQASIIDSRLQMSLDAQGELVHQSVGLILYNGLGQILLAKRRIYPLTQSLIFGHLRNGETVKQAAQREVVEEIGFRVTTLKPLFTDQIEVTCRTGISKHHLSVFELHIPPHFSFVPNRESSEMNWVWPQDIKSGQYRPLGKATEFILTKLGLYE